jgi:diaminohydroxyphosphoribosylaminopyrimidine deaminase/5-amino-6-(5-phosphoribosylamino)uracil reductase
LVGKNTASHDDPSLNVREWVGENPVRLVIDSRLELPRNLKLFDQTIPTICFNTLKSEKQENLEYVKLREAFEISDLLDELVNRNIQSILVEGGSFLLSKFIASGLWDEARVFTSQNKFEVGIPAPKLNLISTESYQIQSDLLQIYYHV